MKETAKSPSRKLRVFQSKWFQRFARKEGIETAALLEAVYRAEQGQIDANLGGGVLKQRIARSGEGKSGGYRTIVFFRQGMRAVFMFGFLKSERRNITLSEERAFKEAAIHVLRLTDEQMAALVRNGDFVEVKGT